MSLLLLRSPAYRLAYAALALSFSVLASVAPTPVVAQGLPDFTELVEKVGPAVVNIRTTERGRTARGGSGNEQDEEMAELFRRFFGVPGQPNRPNPRGPQQAPDGEPQPRGVGSGFILSTMGT